LEYRNENGNQQPFRSDYAEEFNHNNSISKSGFDKIMMDRLKNFKSKNLVGTISLIDQK
jgi:hypothetical protein